MAFSAVIFVIILNHNSETFSQSAIESVIRAAMILALGFPLFFSVKIFFERKPESNLIVKNGIYSAGIIILVLYYIFLLAELNSVSATRYSILTLVLYLVFLFIPMVFKKESFELFVVKLFVSFFTVVLYSVILFGGIAAVIASTVFLFKLTITERIYTDIAAIIFGGIAPVLFLSYIPEEGKKLSVEEYSKIVKVLFLYIILPIVSVFAVIFYVYFFTILFKPWPSNRIFRIAFYFLLTSVVAAFFVYPLRSVSKWAKNFIFIFPKLLLPFIILMFMSLVIRIQAYGFTFMRYFLLVASVWLAFALIYLSFFKSAKNIILLISLSILMFLSIAGPWNFASVTKASQSKIFYNILSKYDMVQNNQIVKSSNEVSEEDKISFTSIISYYGNHLSFKDLKYLPDNFNYNKMNEVLGFEPAYYRYNNYGNDFHYFSVMDSNYVINAKDYDYVSVITYNNQTKVQAAEGDLYVIAENNSITIKNKGETIYIKKIEDILGQIGSSESMKEGLTQKEMTIHDENESISITYLIDNAGYERNTNSGVVRINQFKTTILIKLKK